MLAPPRIDIKRGNLPPAALAPVGDLNIRGADLRDVLRAIASEHGLSLIVDDGVQRTVTVSLHDVPVIDVLVHLAEAYGVSLIQTGAVFRVQEPEPTAPPPPTPRVLRLDVADGALTADLSGDPIQDVVRAVAERGGINVVVRQGVDGAVSGFLQGVPLEPGLRTLLANNGFVLRHRDGVYVVDRAGASVGPSAPASTGFFVAVEVGRVSLDVAGAGVADVLREVALQAGLDLVTYRVPEGQITAKFDSLGIDQALGYLLRDTGITFRREGDLYVIGSNQSGGVVSSRLIRLKHIKAESITELLPEVMRQGTTLQVLKEQNGLVVTGSPETIADIEGYVGQIDFPTPQILIEALVVDFDKTDFFELGVAYGVTGDPAALDVPDRAGFGGANGFDGGIVAETGGRRLNGHLNTFGDAVGDALGVGLGVIGRLPDDFYLRIRALERDGRATVRSRPQISTLNGYSASISIGTTQYYLLKTSTPVVSGGNVVAVESERFEQIAANVSLEITPWVAASGEVTVEISPEFSTPVGGLDPNVPPTINTRVLQSTVRVRDGETIILGGLIQESTVRNYNRVPVLGNIPILGRLFRSESSTARKSELVIYITPHVFYGDERDQAKWDRLRQRLRLRGPELGAERPPTGGDW